MPRPIQKHHFLATIGILVGICGALSLHPSAVLAISCKNTTECPSGLFCLAGSCSVVPGGTSLPSTAPTPAAGAGTKTTTPAKPAAPPSSQLQIAPKNPECLKVGNCTLDDIVATGASFANLLTAISGALFLGAFVYGGFAYLLSRGDKKWVEAGKKAMTTSSFGMIIIMGAWVIVNFVKNSLTGGK